MGLRVKSRIMELASKNDRLIGLLAVEISLALYDPTDHGMSHMIGFVYFS